ncbi:MAG: ATP-binding protein [Bacteriovoracaceae bacterium]|nr:ATP-binding protein [Bacteriovoracaceae bacterium]
MNTWITRTLESVLENKSGPLNSFPIILITGPRQIGKSSILKKYGPNFQYITFDDREARTRANQDPALFLKGLKAPFILDEIQYAPELLSYLKILVDQGLPPKSIFLTGSQYFQVMKGVQESLAGRVAIINLYGFSDNEKRITHQNPIQYFENIFETTFPKLFGNTDVDERALYLSSYLQTYVERDISELLGLQKRREFEIFLKICALRTGQIINYDSMAKDAHISPSIAKDWLSVLQDSFLIKIVQPFHSNKSKRLIKSPKLYFLDTGLATYLAGWKSPEQLYLGPQNGAFFENHIFTNILKKYRHAGREVDITFWRTRDQQEVDFIVETSKTTYPVEVKMGSVSPQEICDFQKIAENENWDEGKIISLSAGITPIYIREKWKMYSPNQFLKLDL